MLVTLPLLTRQPRLSAFGKQLDLQSTTRPLKSWQGIAGRLRTLP